MQCSCGYNMSPVMDWKNDGARFEDETLLVCPNRQCRSIAIKVDGFHPKVKWITPDNLDFLEREKQMKINGRG